MQEWFIHRTGSNDQVKHKPSLTPSSTLNEFSNESVVRSLPRNRSQSYNTFYKISPLIIAVWNGELLFTIDR